MPLVQIQMMAGRTAEQIDTLIAEVTDAIHRSVGAPVETIRVLVVEIPKTHWGIGGKSASQLGR